MKLDRLPHDPSALLEFYEDALGHLGALCERTWHDRLEVVAEGAAARLWDEDAALREVALHFVSGENNAPRDAAREVFPGCPLTFRLAETLRPSPLPLDRAVLAADPRAQPPEPEIGEKLWHRQFPGSVRWRMQAPFAPSWHFSLVALMRCETQSIEQHWSLHRLALSLPGGEPDEILASELATLAVASSDDVPWPNPDAPRWKQLLAAALETATRDEIALLRERQEHYLRRELGRIDEYFLGYQTELTARATRSHAADGEEKLASRLAATRAERTRRRQDQIARHEIRVIAHVDALLLIAEPAWSTRVSHLAAHPEHETEARFIPRARRWVV